MASIFHKLDNHEVLRKKATALKRKLEKISLAEILRSKPAREPMFLPTILEFLTEGHVPSFSGSG